MKFRSLRAQICACLLFLKIDWTERSITGPGNFIAAGGWLARHHHSVGSARKQMESTWVWGSRFSTPIEDDLAEAAAALAAEAEAAAAGGGGAASTEQAADKAVPAPAATTGGADFCQAPGRETALSMNAIFQTMKSFYIVNTAQYYQILRT